ncbi:MAG: TPM domain-containing protein [Myxococcales bacterium]|nr:TPM domain-containing protein [Myxococcales bacterium]
MFKRRFLTRDNEASIVAATQEAERGNQGEVRVHLEQKCDGDALERARDLFGRFRMHETSEGTGLLLYVAITGRKAAVFAGEGLVVARDPSFWQSISDSVAAGFRDGLGPEALVSALGRLGDVLREVAPGPDVAGNELPDEVTVGHDA